MTSRVQIAGIAGILLSLTSIAVLGLARVALGHTRFGHQYGLKNHLADFTTVGGVVAILVAVFAVVALVASGAMRRGLSVALAAVAAALASSFAFVPVYPLLLPADFLDFGCQLVYDPSYSDLCAPPDLTPFYAASFAVALVFFITAAALLARANRLGPSRNTAARTALLLVALLPVVNVLAFIGALILATRSASAEPSIDPELVDT